MVERALFTVPLADLDYGEREIDQEIPVEWLATTLEGSEATPQGPGRFEATVSKTGREVMVRGRVKATVTLPCARTLDPAAYDLDTEVFLLLQPAASVPDGPKPQRKQTQKGARGAPAPRPSKGEEEAKMREEEAARDTYDGDRVVLDRFVREFLVLELPMVPLREDLRSEATPGIERPPEPAQTSRSTREAIDPRLAPLAAIASRLRDKKE
jgi:uncharacterized protein